MQKDFSKVQKFKETCNKNFWKLTLGFMVAGSLGLYGHSQYVQVEAEKAKMAEIQAEIEKQSIKSDSIIEDLGLATETKETKEVSLKTKSEELKKSEAEVKALEQQIKELEAELGK